MNPEQIKSAARWVVTTFGGMFAGWAAAKGWMSAERVMSILTSEAFIGFVVSAVGLALSMYRHTKANTVAATDAMPEVAGVVTKQTPEGRELAKDVPSKTVAAAGTADAMQMAR